MPSNLGAKATSSPLALPKDEQCYKVLSLVQICKIGMYGDGKHVPATVSEGPSPWLPELGGTFGALPWFWCRPRAWCAHREQGHALAHPMVC